MVNRITRLIQRKRKPSSPTGKRAGRAAELNAAISQLWQDQATHSKADFNEQIVPIYTALLHALKLYQTTEESEQTVIDLLINTAKACRHRWTVRLPMRRPGSDYRKYEIIYTDALVTAMAVGSLIPHISHRSPEQLADKILPTGRIKRFKADPIVWEDWLGYFQRAERGGLYSVSIGEKHAKPLRQTPHKSPVTSQHVKPPPAGSGRAMLEAIRSALADGTLSFNQPGDAVQVDREGRTFLEHPKILQWCGEQLDLGDDLKKLKSRFSRLKVHKRSGQGNQLYYGRLGKQDRRRIGYVLENPTVLWLEKAPAGQFVIERVTP